MTQSGVQAGEASGALRREVSMKIKKKQLLSNQTFKVRTIFCLKYSVTLKL